MLICDEFPFILFCSVFSFLDPHLDAVKLPSLYILQACASNDDKQLLNLHLSSPPRLQI